MKNEKELLEQLVADVEDCGKDKVTILAGHFPLVYTDETAIEALDYWGHFTLYTWEMGCDIGQVARDRFNKDVEFVFFVDDHSYEDNATKTRQVKNNRRRLYRLRSGPDARLPRAFRKVMNAHSFDESDVIRQDQEKHGRHDCLYFSEKLLRARGQMRITNDCAREYTAFIEDPIYFNKDNTHLIAFITQRCSGNVCDVALDHEIRGLSASHVFLETMVPWMEREDLFVFGRGVTYRREKP